jgi:hypothetical protein
MSQNQIESNDSVCVILVGKTTDHAKAEKLVKESQNCPYVALYTAQDDKVCGVFTLPRQQEEWYEYPEDKPKFLDFDEVLMTVVTDELHPCSPWTEGKVKAESETTPCGKRCDQCTKYPDMCRGCPATIFYYAAS